MINIKRSENFAQSRKCFFVNAATFLFAGIMFLVTIYIYYPGLMTNDTLATFHQAKSFVFTDIVPPIMPFTWFFLNHIYFGTAPMLIFNNLIFWTALGLFSFWLFRESAFYRIIFIFCFGIFPPIFTQLGVILKDIPQFSSLFLACTLLLIMGRTTNKLVKFILLLLMVLFLFYAYMLRHNSFAAVIVLCFWVGNLLLPSDLTYKKIMVLFFGIGLFGLFSLADHVITHKLTKDRTYYPAQIVILGDLTGISAIEGKTIFPNYLLVNKKLVNNAMRKYSPSGFYDSGLSFDCNKAHFQELEKFWIKSIFTYPFAYIKHRAMVFSRLFISSCQYNYLTDNYVNGKNIEGFVFHPNYLYKIYYQFADLFVFKVNFLRNVNNQFYQNGGYAVRIFVLFTGGIYWIICLLMSIKAFFARKRLKHALPVFWIALSGFFYGAGYIVYGPTAEYRFWLWTVVSAMMATVIYIRDVMALKNKNK